MPEAFLQLSEEEQSQIYRGLSPKLGRAPDVLEKDVWVCWVLQALFTMPNRLTMAFKGGTSLSKVFGAIQRFSEDVDITLDYRGLDPGFDPFATECSRRQKDAHRARLERFVAEHTHSVVAPHLQERLEVESASKAHHVEVLESGDGLRVHYPTLFPSSGGYIGSSVLIEFGGRNITDPNKLHEVKPYIAEPIEGLVFPCSQVSVLSPARTFWEKATLIHVACHRRKFQSSAARQSRHWYDLAMLADMEIGRAAIQDQALLQDVVKHKKVFFHVGGANYDACLNRGLRLIPDDDEIVHLRNDYQQMDAAGMFIGQTPAFDTIIDRLRKLEAVINQ